MKELIEEIFNLKKEKENLEKELEDKKTSYTSQISKLDTEIQLKEKDLLNAMKAAESKEIDIGNIVATWFSKENISYKSDSEVLNYLKDNNYKNLITVKTTESINKNALKKELKTNENLQKALDNLTIKSITDYVVVTSKENHEKMLEHIEQNKKGS